jgi:hypothetical protein
MEFLCGLALVTGIAVCAAILLKEYLQWVFRVDDRTDALQAMTQTLEGICDSLTSIERWLGLGPWEARRSDRRGHRRGARETRGVVTAFGMRLSCLRLGHVVRAGGSGRASANGLVGGGIP